MEVLITDKLECSVLSAMDRRALDDYEKVPKKCSEGKSRHGGACLGNLKCDNYMSQNECPARCGKGCGNRRIVKGIRRPEMRLVSFKNKGKGLIAQAEIPEGTFIFEYVGEIKRKKKYEADSRKNPDIGFYGMELVSGWIVDASSWGNWSRYCNHSCQPNLRMEEWRTDDGLPRLVLVADMKINTGDELTFDYGLKRFKGTKPLDCHCNNVECRYKVKPKVKRGFSKTCLVCHKEFKRRYNFLRHQKIHVQAGNPKFMCALCLKFFPRKDHLKRHERTHITREKKFECIKCNKSFYLVEHLRRHERSKHDETFTKYSCNSYIHGFRECKRKYASLSGLQRHRKKFHKC